MAHKLNNLNLDFYTHIKFLGYNHTIQLHDISKLVKLEPLRIKGIYLTEVDEEILQPKVTEKFRNRFPDVDILSKEIYRIWIWLIFLYFCNSKQTFLARMLLITDWN